MMGVRSAGQRLCLFRRSDKRGTCGSTRNATAQSRHTHFLGAAVVLAAEHGPSIYQAVECLERPIDFFGESESELNHHRAVQRASLQFSV